MLDTCENRHIQEAHIAEQAALEKDMPELLAEQAALEKDMRELLAVCKPTATQNREYCRLKARHVAVLEEVDRARVEPMASPWSGSSMIEPATPDETDIHRKASTLIDDEDDGEKDEKELMLPEFTSSVALSRAKGQTHHSAGWHLSRYFRPSCRPIVYTTVYAAPLAQRPPPQPDQSSH
jgi:hypothetical protein